MNVSILSYTQNPEQVVAAAAKTCYSNSTISELMDGLNEENTMTFIRKLRTMGHKSPFEHASFTFAIDGVSRSLLAQITRHRIASFSVQSQRYVGMNGFNFVAPAAVQKNPYTLRIFDDMMDETNRAYQDIYAYLMSEYLREKYKDVIPCDNPKYFYLSLDAHFDPRKGSDEYKSYRKVRNAAEKYANENARCVLPNAATTRMIVTMNARELMHFFSLRCCNRAQDEIRDLADKMLELCKSVAPSLFEGTGAPCMSGACPEGPMTCGHPRKSKEEK